MKKSKVGSGVSVKCIFFWGGGGAKYKKGVKMTKRVMKSYLSILFTEPIIDFI